MKTVLIIVNIVLISTCLQAHPTPEEFISVVPVFKQPYGDGDGTRIVGGKDATPGQFPYQAGLVIDSAAFCGGSLISKNWVLTAGHCVQNFNSWVVVLGAHDISNTHEEGSVTVYSKKAVRHEKYDAHLLANDIGVVNLPEGVAFTSRIKPIKLPSKSLQNKDLTGQVTRVSGWGRTSDSLSTSQTLKYVDLSVITNAQCALDYGDDVVTKTKYCCSGQGGKSTCNGDSGGSLTIVNGSDVTNIGIVSFGHSGGCSKGYPSGYTATPFFLDWISNKTGIAIQ